MKIRTSLGAGIAAAAVASTVLGLSTPALAIGASPWNTKAGDTGTAPAGLFLSSDGTTAFAVISPTYDPATDSVLPASVVPVDTTTGLAGTATSVPATSLASTSTAGNGSTVAVLGSDNTGSFAWDITDGVLTALPLTDANSVAAVAATADGFVAVGQDTNGCLQTWTWATDATTTTAGTPTCSGTDSYVASAVAVQPGTGAVYVAVTDFGASATYQLWNLSDPTAAKVTLTGVQPTSVIDAAADGTVYLAAAGGDSGDNSTQLVTVDPSGTGTATLRGTGYYGISQVSLVGGQLWLGTGYAGIAVMDPAADTSYTVDAPAPVLAPDNGPPAYFATSTAADYLLAQYDLEFDDGTSVPTPGLMQVVAPQAPAPHGTSAGSSVTVSWVAPANDGGAPATTATVVPTDTTTNTVLDAVTATIDPTTPSVAVTGLTQGDTYTFAVTQGNGFFSSASASTAPVLVKLPATAKPSAVSVVGKPLVGTKLTVKTTGTWGTGAALTYAWYANTTKVATTASYAPKAADVGKRIKVAVTGIAPGHSASTVTSAYVGPVSKPVYKVPNKPTITGIAKVGRILTAHITGLPAGAVVKYQWAFNGGQYGGAIGRPTTSTTLKVPASVKGTRIEVIAFVTVPGYATGSAMSALTAVVK